VLRVRLLGELRVERDGAQVPLPASAARVLAYLALRPDAGNRDTVAATLWPDTGRDNARANLRTALWSLRRALGGDAVVASRGSVRLSTELVHTDLAELSGACHTDAAAAEALTTSDVLSGLDDAWAAEARAAHRDRQVELLDRLAEGADAAADPARAVRWSRRRCAATPLDEPAHRALLRRLAAAGDRAGAVLAGQEFTARLSAELGVTPGPATRAALARLHAGPAEVTAHAHAEPPRGPLFGRAGELAALTAAWSSARTGAGQVALITGEAGIGKTRLVTELARRADNAGGRVAVGAGIDIGGEAPLAVWLELARELAHAVPPPPARAVWPRELGRLAPELAALLGQPGPPTPVAAPELERVRIFDGVLRLVEWAAEDRPLLLVAEDVHRADRASMALCAHLSRRLARLPVLFVLTRRDRPERPEADAVVAELIGSAVPVTELELRPLGEREVVAIVRSRAGALPERDVQRVVDAADGNPLLAVESARALAAGRDELPPSLRAGVRASLRGLPPAARELAEAVAVAGRELRPGEIAALGLTDRATAEHRALDSGLLRRRGGALRFRHALLAEAARADLADPTAVYLRLAFAVEAAAETALGADATPGAEPRHVEVARLLGRADRDDLAAPRWCRAAGHARSVGALPEAAAFWAEATRCAPAAAGPWLELGEVHAWLGRVPDYERAWQTALGLLTPAETPGAWCRRGRLLRGVMCHPAGSLVAYRTALELMPAVPDAAVRAEALLGVAWGEAVAGDPAVVDGLLDEVARLLPQPDASTTADLEGVRLHALIRLGRFDECASVAERAGTAAARAHRPDLAYGAWVNAACVLAAGGDLAAALTMADRAIAAVDGIAMLTVRCLAARTHLLSRLGRHDEATACVRGQLELARRLDSAPLEALTWYDAGLVALAAGRFGEAAGLLGDALDAGAELSRPAARLARAEALAAAGDPGRAELELRAAVCEPVGPGDQAWALVPRAARVQGLIARGRGDSTVARARLREAAAGWRRLRPPRLGDSHLANLVDLGRPPVVGLVEPERELARVRAELADLDEPGGKARAGIPGEVG
jgi:DNA-binding SARP family transcriptional activator/tetratricopeptide (TPR) repeat protein